MVTVYEVAVNVNSRSSTGMIKCVPHEAFTVGECYVMA
jgi:hypothetical protein